MKRFITVVSLGLGLVTFSGGALAQEGGVPTINADGSSGTSTAGLNPAVDADGPTIVYGDLNPGAGTTVIGPPAGESAPASTDLAPAPAPGTTQDLTATDGNAATLGPGNASAAPGTVTHDGSSGMSLLGPDGTYSVTEVSPSDVTVGDSGAAAPVYDPVYDPAYDPALEPAPEYVAETTETAEPVVAETAAVSEISPSDVTVGDSGVAAPVYDPVYDPALEPAPEYVAETTEIVEPVVAETAAVSETDLDADNYADALEWDLGLDPNNADSDADGVADGDEITIYGTEPTVADTDGDGIADGEELFALQTDPLIWDTNGDGLGDGEPVLA